MQTALTELISPRADHDFHFAPPTISSMPGFLSLHTPFVAYRWICGLGVNTIINLIGLGRNVGAGRGDVNRGV